MQERHFADFTVANGGVVPLTAHIFSIAETRQLGAYRPKSVTQIHSTHLIIIFRLFPS